MPIYSYRCPSCGRDQDGFNRISDRDASPPMCCGSQTERQVTACMITVRAFENHKSVITGEIIQSERQRSEMMKREGLRDANDMKPEQVIAAAKKKRADNQALADQLTAIPAELMPQVDAMLANSP